MKATEKAAAQAAVFGVIAGGAAYWLLTGAAWWVPVILGVGVMGVAYQKFTKDIANGNVEAQEKR